MGRKSTEKRPSPIDLVHSGSDSVMEASQRNGDSNRNSPTKKRKNFVERRSSVAGTNSGGWSWKDMMCVGIVIVLVALVGALRLQEELFGTVEKMRLESDGDADYYEILGIPHSATLRDIKRAFRDKVKEVHPDHHPNCHDCEKRFISCTKAYDVLVDPEQRKVYDETRGSYEPIMSDYSVSLTSFNYQRLVAESASVWVIQVYDDLDSHSVHFASQWDAVAGSSELSSHIKFGRVNARRDRGLLSRLPIRAKLFPTVMLFTRDTMPSIFSIADTSSKALRKWIQSEIPHHVGETTSSNKYEAVITGTRTIEKALSVPLKAASVRFSRVFDFAYIKGDKPSIAIRDKASGNIVIPATSVTETTIIEILQQIQHRLVVPLTKYNLYDLCKPVEESVLCVSTSHMGPVLPQPIEDSEFVFQRIHVASSDPSQFAIDLTGSMIARIKVDNVENLMVDDLEFNPITEADFIHHFVPSSVWDTIMEYNALFAVAVVLAVTMLVFTQLGAVKITIAVLGLSLVIGAVNSIGNWKELIR
jgi:curved DNA-binding protein CbpA